MTTLYHVGCGRPLFDAEQARSGTLAIACACGADSPICVAHLDSAIPDYTFLPLSLDILFAVSDLTRKREDKPHLEYYLGFDQTFTCPAKTAWEEEMRRCLGLIGFAECDQQLCQATPERVRQRQAYFERLRT